MSNIYKSAVSKKLRFNTEFGQLTTEQLFDLDLNDLDKVAVALEEQVEKSPKKSFLVESSEEDKIAKLKFDVALDILQTKIDYRERAAKAAETKARNQKIAEILAKKQDKALEEKSVEELEAMLEG